MSFNLAELHEAIAAAIPERDCIVFRERRLSWGEVTARTRRLASYLLRRGLGHHTPRSRLQRWESGQDHLALYLHNGNEYLEGMIGAFKARLAPINVNYRYTEAELLYVLRDSGARAIVFHARLAPTLQRVRAHLPRLELLVQVADDSNEPLLPGAIEYESALRLGSEERLPVLWSPDDLYILYTGGTTGMPKGVLWRQHDIFLAGLGGRKRDGSPWGSAEQLQQLAASKPARRALPVSPFMHGAGHWAAFIAFHAGMTVVVQSEPERFDAHDILSTIERERVTSLALVGDAFARPLLDRMAEHAYDLSCLRLITSSGAILNAGVKRELFERLPGVTLVDAVGSSETGPQALQISTPEERTQPASFQPQPGTCILSDDLSRVLAPNEREVGWLGTRGFVPLGYLGDPAKTKRTFPLVDGVRYAVPGDRVRWSEAGSGRIELLGRDSVTINTGGEKVFAEEVEQLLRQHPAVHDAVVCGRASARWGQEVCAIVKLRPGATVQPQELLDACATQLARYKLPKAFFFRDELVRSASGKPDYRWAAAVVAAAAS